MQINNTSKDKQMKRIIPFILLFILMIVMGVATFVEKEKGTDVAARTIYGAAWFTALWALATVTALNYYLRSRKPFYNLLLHGSLVLILIGALLTSLTARHGTIHLRQDETVHQFTEETGDGTRTADLPFTLTLKRFQVDYHQGTTSPADYRSEFILNDAAHGVRREGSVAMNHIYTYRGVRLYQSSYDQDNQGSYLSLNDDPWGLPVTYAGYGLLFISLVWMLLAPQGGFRRLLRRPELKKGLFAIGLLLASTTAQAVDVLPKQQAERMGELLIEYNGRVCPLQTAAIDFTKKLTGGKSSYQGYTAEQVFTGFLFYRRTWNNEPLIRVKSNALCKAAGVDSRAALKDFFSSSRGYVLGPLIDRFYHGDKDAVTKAAADIDDRLQLILSLQHGEWMRLFPVKEHDVVRWCTPADDLSTLADTGQALFIRNAFNLIYESAVSRPDAKAFDEIMAKIADYQKKYGGASLPSATSLRAERLYNALPFADILFKCNLTLGLALLLLLIRRLLKNEAGRRPWERYVSTASVCLLVLSFAMLTFGLVLRYLIAGRLPLGNGYETMLVMAWCVQLITLALLRRFPYLLSFGFLLSGFFLLVSSISQMDPQITPLMPVLSSPLLSIHVSLIMMAYALFSFTFLCALIAWILVLAKGKHAPGIAGKTSTLQLLSRLFLYPALTLLGIGIFIGAIWANQSWGRYWGWDPKEVWALINFLFYAVALHGASLPWFRKPMNYHLYMIVAFLTVLMTYIGVNYFLGGMHSYA